MRTRRRPVRPYDVEGCVSPRTLVNVTRPALERDIHGNRAPVIRPPHNSQWHTEKGNEAEGKKAQRTGSDEGVGEVMTGKEATVLHRVEQVSMH